MLFGASKKEVSVKHSAIALLVGVALLTTGCGLRYFGSPLKPMASEQQGPAMTVSDDGTVTYTKERLEISLRPMTDEELNRQFSSVSKQGNQSTNPYTYGNWRQQGDTSTPVRFTVFRLKVKNYTYPKVEVDPEKITIHTENGREYAPLSLHQMEKYYHAYARGYSGASYRRFKARKDILKQTMYMRDIIFSGQDREGYVIFPKLDSDVRHLSITLKDIAFRFNVFGEPVESTGVTFQFQREIYKDRGPRT